MRKIMLRLQKPLALMLSILPVHLFLYCLWLKYAPLLWCLTPGLYLLFACLCLLPRGRLRLPCGIACGALLLGSALLLTPWLASPGLLITPILYTAVLMYYLRMGGWTPDMELGPQPFLVGGAAYILIQFITGVMPENYGPMLLPLRASFLLWLLLLLLYMNRLSLSAAMIDDRRKPPEQLRRRNLVLVWLTFGAAVFISLIPAIGQALNSLWDGLIALVHAFIAWLSSLFVS